MPKVTAQVERRVRLEVPERPEFDGIAFWREGEWHVVAIEKDGGLDLIRHYDIADIPQDIIRIPSEAEAAHLEERGKLLERLYRASFANDGDVMKELRESIATLDAAYTKSQDKTTTAPDAGRRKPCTNNSDSTGG